MVVWASSFSITMSLLKLLQVTHVVTALTARLGFALIILIPGMIKNNLLSQLPDRLPLFILNGITRGAAFFCVYYAYSKLPMAIAASIGYTDSLITAVMAMVILKEKVRLLQWVAIITGYIGVLVMYEPQGASFNIALGIALLSNIFASIAKITTKKLTATESNSSILFYGQIIAFVCCLGFSIQLWQAPNLHDIYCLMIISAAGTLSGYAYIQALRHGDVAFVAPLDYIKLLLTLPIGFIVFNEIPTLHAAYGATLIILASMILLIKPRYKKNKYLL